MIVMNFIKKIRRFYLSLPLRVRLSFLIAVFTILAVVSIGFNNYRMSTARHDKGYLADNNLGGGGNTTDNKDETDMKEEPKPKEVIVVIDPGHGGEDIGAYNGTLYEKDINLDISLRMGKLLEESGIKVVYTRETDIFLDLGPRIDIANNLGATLFISVHNNSMPNNSQYRGTETLYCPPVNAKYSKMDGRKLAIIVQKELVNTLKTVDNGIILRPNLAVIRKTQMPAVIAEIAYISNASDRAKLKDNTFRQKAANALANAVMKALDDMGAVRDENGVLTVMEN